MSPLVKFDIGIGWPVVVTSRNQAWKYQVWPAWIASGPPGCGMAVKSRALEKLPLVPEFMICPGPTKRLLELFAPQ